MRKLLSLLILGPCLGLFGDINVKNLGAKGDGLTDDTAAIQSALIQSSPTNAAYVPAGTYICGSLFVNTGNRLRGDGWNSVLKDKTNILFHLLSPTNRTTNPSVSNVFIGNLKLLGNSMGQNNGGPMPFGYSSVHGIAMLGARNWTVTNVWAEDFDGDGIYMGRNFSNPANVPAYDNTVTHCTMQKNVRNGGMLSYGSGNVWSYNVLAVNQVGMDPTSPKYSPDVYNSAEFDLEPNRLSIINGVTTWETAISNIFLGNVFFNGRTRGMQIAKFDAPVQFNTFKDNIFINCRVNLSLMCAGAHSNLFMENLSIQSGGNANGHWRISGPSGNKLIFNRFVGGQVPTNSSRPIVIDGASWTNAMTNMVFSSNIVEFSNVPAGDGTSVYIGSTVKGIVLLSNELIGAKFDIRGTVAP